jgi:hypothetical protein
MNMRPYKVKFPREEDDREFQRWLTNYELESRNFSVCKLIEQIGTNHSLNKVIRLHDEITGVNYRQSLA